MLFNIKTDNYFLYNKTERAYLLKEAMEFYLSKFVTADNRQTYYVSLNELKHFFIREEILSVQEERYEEAEIYKHLAIMSHKILEQMER